MLNCNDEWSHNQRFANWIRLTLPDEQIRRVQPSVSIQFTLSLDHDSAELAGLFTHQAGASFHTQKQHSHTSLCNIRLQGISRALSCHAKHAEVKKFLPATSATCPQHTVAQLRTPCRNLIINATLLLSCRKLGVSQYFSLFSRARQPAARCSFQWGLQVFICTDDATFGQKRTLVTWRDGVSNDDKQNILRIFSSNLQTGRNCDD